MKLFKTQWHSIIVVILALVSSSTEARVSLGNERLFTDYADILKGKRIGILAHYASRMNNGTHIVDALSQNRETQLTLIFSPEHGFRSLDDTTVTDSIDPATGVQIYSLYGPRKAPTPEMLARLDLILVDLQDVGLRYYTYPATVSYLLRAAKLANKPVYLLDRPNPIGADQFGGAILDAQLANEGLTTIAKIPTRTGMTLGETALFLNNELKINADLHIIPLQNYSRAFHWNDTGLSWVPSSPALVDPEQVELYAIFGSLEAADLASGRGMNNAQAFRRFGAPYLSESKVKLMLSQLNLPGLNFSYVEWTPDRSKYIGQLCRGIQIEITDLAQIQNLRSLIEVSQALHLQFGTALKLDKALSMYGSQWLLDGILKHTAPADLVNRAERELQAFQFKRQAVLLYP